MIDDTETPSISVDGEQQPQEQARGKGRMPEAGPRHCTAGLRVKPERAAAGTFSAAASIASTAATAIEAARSVTHLPCRAVCVRHVTVCDRPGPLCTSLRPLGPKCMGKSRSELLKTQKKSGLQAPLRGAS